MVEPGLQVPPDLAVQLTPAQPGDSDYAHRTTSNLPPHIFRHSATPARNKNETLGNLE